MRVPKERLSLFFQLLSFGGMHEIETGFNLKDVLCRQLGIDQAYLDTQIQTIFVDGKAMDAIDDEFVRDGTVIALSAAMPGLVGAVFRKGGILKSLRSQIIQKKSPLNQNIPEGTITLKLFNQVAADMGPVFLERGIRIQGDDFKWFFDRNVTRIVSICSDIEINGRKTKIEENMFEGLTEGDITLTVHAV